MYQALFHVSGRWLPLLKDTSPVAAAGCLTHCTSSSYHTTSILAALYWLPVSLRNYLTEILVLFCP